MTFSKTSCQLNLPWASPDSGINRPSRKMNSSKTPILFKIRREICGPESDKRMSRKEFLQVLKISCSTRLSCIKGYGDGESDMRMQTVERRLVNMVSPTANPVDL